MNPDPQNNSPQPNPDELFVIKPIEKKPLDKKSIIIVATLSIIGVILLIVVLVFALVGSASGLANDYRRLAAVQINKINKPLNDLNPSTALDGRNLDDPIKTIDASEQSQPNLENVLFVGAWSERYTQTAVLEKKIHKHYQNIASYADDLKKLLAFDSAMNGIFDQEPNLSATINPADSLSLRSASGSYENFAKAINNQLTPSQASQTKKQLAEIYRNKSTIYLTWASSVESGNPADAGKAQTDLLAESAKAISLTEDKSLADLMVPSYNPLTKDQQLLKKQLAS